MIRYIKIAVLLAVFTVIGASAANAQTRTWVSGVGDDLNPCSRTAPCKTFAGAISKTSAGGEISVLDPGGYGCVTITKSITINGEGTLASALGAGVNCITVNDSATATPGTIFVTLRHLSVQGVGTGLSGIRLVSGAALIVEHVIVTGFQTGISTSMGNATVVNSMITRNTSFGGRAIGGAISFENTTFANNGIAIQPDAVGTIRISNSSFYNNGTAFSCLVGGTLSSTGDNRKANNTGGGGTVCTPNAVTVVQ